MRIFGDASQLVNPLLRAPGVRLCTAFAHVVGKLHALGSSNAFADEDAALGLFDVAHDFDSVCICRIRLLTFPIAG